MSKTYEFSEKEVYIIDVVLSELFNKFDYDTLNTFLGSETIREAYELKQALKYRDYCARHGLKSWHDMDEDDYESYAYEKMRNMCSNYE